MRGSRCRIQRRPSRATHTPGIDIAIDLEGGLQIGAVRQLVEHGVQLSDHRERFRATE